MFSHVNNTRPDLGIACSGSLWWAVRHSGLSRCPPLFLFNSANVIGSTLLNSGKCFAPETLNLWLPQPNLLFGTRIIVSKTQSLLLILGLQSLLANNIYYNNHKLTGLVLSLCFCSLVAKLKSSVSCSLLVGDTLQLFSLRGFQDCIMDSCKRICTEPTNRNTGQKKIHYVQFQTKEKGLHNGVVKEPLIWGVCFLPQNVINTAEENMTGEYG